MMQCMLEEMKEKCSDCRKIEENIFWTRFNSMHFCQFVNGDFRSQLMIPKTFSDNMRGKLHRKVTLKGPGGATWEVRLVQIDDALFLKYGWEEFASAHFLKENDILMFNYKGKSEFDVLIIDGQTLCENISSCFVKRCGHNSICRNNKDQQQLVKNQRKECSVEIVNDDSEPEDDNHDPDSSLTKKLPGDGQENAIILVSRPKRSKKQVALHEDSSKEGPRKKFRKEFVLALRHPDAPTDAGLEIQDAPPHAQGSVQGWELSTSENGNLPKDILVADENQKHPTNLKYSVVYSSNRRHITSEEKLATVHSAHKDLTDDSFIAIMRATHVYKRFYMSIPQDWLMKHSMSKKQELKLRFNGKTWMVRLIFSSSGRAGLSRGWQQFAVDNCLEEFDVCLFKLGSTDATAKPKIAVFDVSIYRVVPDIVPPTLITAPLHKKSRVGGRR